MDIYGLKLNSKIGKMPKYSNIDDCMTDVFIEHPNADFSEWHNTSTASWMDIIEENRVIGAIMKLPERW